MIKKFLLATFLFFFLAQPHFAQAQLQNEVEYRDYLFAVIELLQKQITQLQIAAERQSGGMVLENEKDQKFTSFLIKDKNELIARYFIDDTSQVWLIENKTHRDFFRRFFELVPGEYEPYFTELIVFEEENNEFDGFVETVPPYRDDTWRFGISESMFNFRAESNVTNELFVHEFAHIISYEGIVGVVEPGTVRCHEYYDDFGCPPESSYLTEFSNIFWSDKILDEFLEEGGSMWSTRELKDDFVTDYAATSPAEDFSESFTDFVLEDYPSGSKLKDEKVRFFYEYDKLVNIREAIRVEI